MKIKQQESSEWRWTKCETCGNQRRELNVDGKWRKIQCGHCDIDCMRIIARDKMLQECKDYLETQMNREDSVVASNKLFQDIKITPEEGTLLSWVWREQLWKIEAKGEITMPLIQVEIKVPENKYQNKMWLSHVQHLTVVMGIITSWYKEQLK